MVKHIVCFGDSNTHGYFPNPDRETYGRYDENERWPRLLQKRIGPEYLIYEEGLTGRTTAFNDPLRESMNGMDSVYSCVMSHEPVDLLIVMLGTNDVKERFGLDADEIASGMERLLRKAASLPGWRDGIPNILLLALVMVFGMVACGADKAPETTAPAETTPNAGGETTPVVDETPEIDNTLHLAHLIEGNGDKIKYVWNNPEFIGGLLYKYLFC